MVKKGVGGEIPVSEALRRKTDAKKSYVLRPTGIDGVSVKLLQGSETPEPAKNLRKFAFTAGIFSRRKVFLDRVNGIQERRSNWLKSFAREHDGVRGIVSDIGKLVLNIYPENSIKWNRKELKEALGSSYTGLVDEDFTLSMTLPAGFMTKEGPMTPQLARLTARAGFLAIGYTSEQLDEQMKDDVILRVDEAAIQERIQDGRIKAEDIDTAGTATDSWVIKPAAWTEI